METWVYLEKSGHPWKRQLYLKGRKLPASSVWISMSTEKLSFEQTAELWDLPVEAIKEVVAYCNANEEMIVLELIAERKKSKRKKMRYLRHFRQK